MRFFLAFIVSCSTFCSFSFKEGLFVDYQVRSDDFDSTLNEGFIKVSGKVLLDGMPRPNALISNGNSQDETRAKANGEYEITFKLTDSTFIFCYHPQAKKELVIKNYEFISQHHIVIDFHLQAAHTIRPMKKPVIYLYANEEMNCTVDIIPNGDLTFTYPQKDDVWNVSLGPDHLPEFKGTAYPYLFWEGEGSVRYMEEEGELLGEVVDSDSLVNYFENRLSQYGLNFKERSDFITFWTPHLLGEKFVFVQWLVDDQYEEHIAELKIDPQPDAIRRLYLLASPLSENSIKVKKQNAINFERSGFTVVEWGGTIIPLNSKSTSL